MRIHHGIEQHLWLNKKDNPIIEFRPSLVDDVDFFSQEYEEAMKKFSADIQWIAQSKLDTLIKMFNFLKYYFYLTDTKTFFPENSVQLSIAKGELKWIFKTLDLGISIFMWAYLQDKSPIDTLTGKTLEELDQELKKDYEIRSARMKATIEAIQSKK